MPGKTGLSRSKRIRYAFFDLDHTITHRDTGALFLRFWMRRHPLSLWRLLPAPFLLAGWKLGLVRLQRVKEHFFGVLRGHAEAAIRAEVRVFLDRILPACCKPEALALLENLRRKGFILVLASASPEFYVLPLAERLGFAVAVAGRYVLRDGSYTGRMEGLDCRGVEKVRRLRALIDLDAYDRSGSLAWSDSTADRPLLALAGQAWYVPRRRWATRPVEVTEHA